MIEVKGLSKSFGDNLVLDNIDETIQKGEKVVVIGPSGSGKSTFLRCLNLLEQPTGGEIWFDDVLIRKDGRFLPEELQCLNPENLLSEEQEDA